MKRIPKRAQKRRRNVRSLNYKQNKRKDNRHV